MLYCSLGSILLLGFFPQPIKYPEWLVGKRVLTKPRRLVSQGFGSPKINQHQSWCFCMQMLFLHYQLHFGPH